MKQPPIKDKCARVPWALPSHHLLPARRVRPRVLRLPPLCDPCWPAGLAWCMASWSSWASARCCPGTCSSQRQSSSTFGCMSSPAAPRSPTTTSVCLAWCSTAREWWKAVSSSSNSTHTAPAAGPLPPNPLCLDLLPGCGQLMPNLCSAVEAASSNTQHVGKQHSRSCPTCMCVCTCRNLAAMCLVFCYQKHLSLRTQVVNPLVLVFIVLASTAALVSQHMSSHGA